MGNSSSEEVNVETAKEYMQGKHELYFKVIYWSAKLNSQDEEILAERWGLEIKDCKSGMLIAYFEYEQDEDKLVDKYNRRHRKAYDKSLITGTLNSNLSELHDLATSIIHQKVLRMGGNGPMKYLDSQLFISEILGTFGFKDIKAHECDSLEEFKARPVSGVRLGSLRRV